MQRYSGAWYQLKSSNWTEIHWTHMFGNKIKDWICFRLIVCSLGSDRAALTCRNSL